MLKLVSTSKNMEECLFERCDAFTSHMSITKYLFSHYFHYVTTEIYLVQRTLCEITLNGTGQRIHIYVSSRILN